MGDDTVLNEWCERLSALGIDLRRVAVDDLVFDERTILKCRYSCPAGAGAGPALPKPGVLASSCPC